MCLFRNSLYSLLTSQNEGGDGVWQEPDYCECSKIRIIFLDAYVFLKFNGTRYTHYDAGTVENSGI